MHLILIDSNSAKCKAKYIANSKSIGLASVSTSDQDRPGSRYFSIATGKDKDYLYLSRYVLADDVITCVSGPTRQCRQALHETTFTWSFMVSSKAFICEMVDKMQNLPLIWSRHYHLKQLLQNCKWFESLLKACMQTNIMLHGIYVSQFHELMM